MNDQLIFKTDFGHLPLYVIEEEFTLSATELETLGGMKRGDFARFSEDYDIPADFYCLGTIEEMESLIKKGIEDNEKKEREKRNLFRLFVERGREITRLKNNLSVLSGILRSLYAVIPVKGIEVKGDLITSAETGEILSE